jgi:hypothetical protein
VKTFDGEETVVPQFGHEGKAMGMAHDALR